MNLNQLRTFLRVTQTGSLRGAADHLRIAQPALSRQILSLEEEIGQALFIRSREGMALTAAGEILQARVAPLLHQLDQVIDDVRSIGDMPKGVVTIGLVPSVAAVIASSLVSQCRAKLPDVRLRIVEGYTNHLAELLHRGEADLCLFYRGGPTHLATFPIAQEDMLFVTSKVDQAPIEAVSIEELAKHPLVLPSAENGLRPLVDKAALRADLKLTVVAEASNWMTMLDMVRLGIGASILPRSLLERLNAKDLSWAQITPPLYRGVELARASNTGSRAVAAIEPILRDISTSLLTLKGGLAQSE